MHLGSQQDLQNRFQYGIAFRLGALTLASATVGGLITLGPQMLAQRQWPLLTVFLVGSIVGILATLEMFLNRTQLMGTGLSHRTSLGRTAKHSYNEIERVIRQPQALVIVLKNGKSIKLFSQQGDLNKAIEALRAQGIVEAAE